MKIRFKHIDQREIVVIDKKPIKIGEIVDVPKQAADYWVENGNAEAVKEAPKTKAKGGND